MGRPLSKRFFGNPANTGKQITLTSAWIPGGSSAVSTAYIVAQKGTSKFIVTDGTNTGLVTLVAGVPAKAGEARLMVTPFGGSAEAARTINAHVVKCFSGKVYRWQASGAVQAGDADLPLS
jgi:hypothetical protein